MDITWDDVRIFLAVAEAGSVSGAARQLRLGQPTISRRLAEMEQAIGSRLFARGVGGATLTSAGERLLAPAKKSDAEKKPVEVSYDATSRGVTVTVPPLPLIGSAAVVSIVSRFCVALIGK